MTRRVRTRQFWPVLAFFVLQAIPVAATVARAQATELSAQLPDTTFWRLVTDFSEPGGWFRSDNFVSNEAAYQYVIPELLSATPRGGVYLGVGPDQNFTYLVAFQPRIAFIVDIRRQNLVQHLMYKALLEMAVDRAEFLSALFSRRRPSGLDTSMTAQVMLEAYASVPPDTTLFHTTLAAIKHRLTTVHGFALSADDVQSLEYVLRAFSAAGPDITYDFGAGGRGYGGFGMPTYSQLMVETDGQGQPRSYLATEENFRRLQDLERRNAIVPVVGDFAGPQALQRIGEWLRQRHATVSIFYTSNVEQYLFQDADNWRRFYDNVATLPLTTESTFIRSLSMRGWVTSQNPNSRSAQLVSSIMEQVRAFREGRLTSYYDVIRMSRY